MAPTATDAAYVRRTTVAMFLLAAFYTVAGVFHLSAPGAFIRVMPAWAPAPRAIIVATGICEIAGVVGLLIPKTRRLAAMALALYAVCVYPANVEHAVQDLSGAHHGLGWLYHTPRLFAQPFIVWWSLYAGGVVGGLRIPAKGR